MDFEIIIKKISDKYIHIIIGGNYTIIDLGLFNKQESQKFMEELKSTVEELEHKISSMI